MLKRFCEANVDTILIGGAIANEISQDFLETAKHHNVAVLLPSDACTVSQLGRDISVYEKYDIPKGEIIVDIGPKTIETFIKEISIAKTIFANGTMGIYEQPAYEIGSKKIFEAIAASSAYSIIGGGDAVAATFSYGLEEQMDFLSTGGGATLAFLSYNSPEEELPVLKIMYKDSCKP
jgi:phosphoglycerate kinase